MELGEVRPEFIFSKEGLGLSPQDVQVNPDAISVFFTNNTGDLVDCYHGQTKNPGYHSSDYKQTAKAQTDLRYICQAIGTFRSAREGKIRNVNEFWLELFAQSIVTGGVKLNPLPDRIKIAPGGWNSERYAYLQKDMAAWAEKTLDRLHTAAEHGIDELLAQYQGKCLVM